MKKLLLAILLLAFSSVLFAQLDENPVTWKYEAKKKSAGVYEIVITANLDKPWHIYSQNTGKDGPIPTKISFKANPLVSLDGIVKENGKLIKTYDNNFKTNVLFYAEQVQFVQTIKVKGNAKTNIAGTVEYMVCNDEKCLPPTKKSFDIKLM
jgi:thiol:disulfide interchange protein DsbD